MGYNTGVIILNDAMGAIERNPEEFVKNMNAAMGEFYRGDCRADIAVGGHCNAATVFHQAHADTVGVYALGGNYASQMLLTFHSGAHHEAEGQVKLLEEMADTLGYRLVKKKPD